MSAKGTLLDEHDIRRALTRIAHEIIERDKGAEDLVLVGIANQGDHLARRLADEIERIEGSHVPVGVLDITASTATTSGCGPKRPRCMRRSSTSTSPGGCGRPGRRRLFHGPDDPAMDVPSPTGRPDRIRLAVLVDRGHRELPIRPDFVGKNVPTRRADDVRAGHPARRRGHRRRRGSRLGRIDRHHGGEVVRRHVLSMHDLSAGDVVRVLDTAESFREVGSRSSRRCPPCAGIPS